MMEKYRLFYTDKDGRQQHIGFDTDAEVQEYITLTKAQGARRHEIFQRIPDAPYSSLVVLPCGCKQMDWCEAFAKCRDHAEKTERTNP